MSTLSSPSDLVSLVKHLEALKHAVPEDEGMRKRLFDAARSLVFALEAPGDSVQRIAYAVRHTGSNCRANG